MSTRVVIDRKALKAVLKESAAQTALDETVKAIKAKAEEIAPVGKVHGGYFQRHFKTRRYPYSRRLMNTDPFAHLVEFGSANNPVYAPMRKAVRALRLRFKENPK